MDAKLTFERLQRKALVYIRQSSMVQVIHNLESQRRQYGLTARAQELGFRDIEVIDEDLGRSGSGCEDRPGFERLVTQVCSLPSYFRGGPPLIEFRALGFGHPHRSNA